MKLSWTSKQAIKGIQFHIYNDPESWIYLPTEATIYASQDGSIFSKACETKISKDKDTKTLAVDIPCKIKSQFIEIKIPALGTIPDNRPGAGNQAWLFLDEIRIY
jgi:hexosaminidase